MYAPDDWWIGEIPYLPNASCKGLAPYFDSEAHPWDLGVSAWKCRQCPERTACFAWASQHKESGIWGGMLFVLGEPRPITPNPAPYLYQMVGDYDDLLDD